MLLVLFSCVLRDVACVVVVSWCVPFVAVGVYCVACLLCVWWVCVVRCVLRVVRWLLCCVQFVVCWSVCCVVRADLCVLSDVCCLLVVECCALCCVR